jgi:4-hydroxybenzoyl-CoA thioesterase
VVLDINVKFKKAARLDDELLVSAELLWVKGVRQGFRQIMTRVSDGVVVATAELSAVMLHADSLKPARMPEWIKAELIKHAE